MPHGTLYPAIDGSTPGEHPDGVGQDITDIPLDPLFDESSVISEPGASQVTEFAPPADNAAPEGTELPADNTRPAGQKTPVQARIDKLTRRSYERDRENTELRQQNQMLIESMQSMNARLAQLTAPRPPASSGQSSNPFDSSERQPSAPTGGLDEGRLEELLDRRLAPVLDNVKARSQADAMRVAHEQSFLETSREFPDLARPDSEFRRHFNEIYDKSPLKQLPDAPYQIALQVRGLLADDRRARQDTTARKVQAGVTVPNQSPPEGAGRAEVNGLPPHVWNEYTANKKKMAAGVATVNDRMQVLRVNQFLNQRKT